MEFYGRKGACLLKEQRNDRQQTEQQRGFITKFVYWAIIAIITYGIIKYASLKDVFVI